MAEGLIDGAKHPIALFLDVSGNLSYMEELAKLDDIQKPNCKITKLTDKLKKLFESNPNSKVIIFVKMRKIAVYLADILNRDKSGLFRANEFMSQSSKEYDQG